MVKISKIQQKDASEVHNIYLTSFWDVDNILEDPNDDYSVLDEKETIKNTTIYLKAEINSQIAGYLKITKGQFTKNIHVGELEIYVLPEFRQMKVATNLIKTGLKYAKNLKLKRIELEVWSNNPAALRLYNKFKFEKEGTRKNAYKINNRYINGILMAKLLN